MLIKYLSVLLCLFIASSNCSVAQRNSNGVFEFSGHDFNNDGAVRLKGLWEFYHNQLLSPSEIINTSNHYFIIVPASWNRQMNIPTLGVATYRCKAILPKNQHGLLLYIPSVNTSSIIWINGEKRLETGKVSADPNLHRPALKNINVPLPEYIDTLEIVIQVANFSYFGSGISTTPTIGSVANLIQKKNENNGVENFFAGGLIAMFIYQIILFFLYNRGKPNLWLAIICIVVAVRSMILNGGSFLLPNLFPSIPFEVWKKMEFGGVYLITAVFPLYIHHLFESSSSKKVVNVFVIITALLIIPVIFTSQPTYGQLLDVCHITLVFTFIYALYTVIKAWKAKNPDAHIIFFGVMASFPFILLEILKNTFLLNFNIHFEYLVESGVLVFLLFQVYILARHYSKSYKSLEIINLELEQEVEQRTVELVDSNKIKERLLSIISHDVKSPLNSLQALVTYYNSNVLTKDEFDEYIKHVEGDLCTTIGLVDNVLFWTANQRKGQDVRIEQVDVKQLIEDSLQHAQATARNKSLKLTHTIPEKFKIKTDRGILNFAIRNLIANAIKYSNQDGQIKITVEKVESRYLLKVIDNGIGMTEEHINSLFNSERVESTDGTLSEKGTGLGISLIKEYLAKINGELNITSTFGKGSTFEVSLPVK